MVVLSAALDGAAWTRATASAPSAPPAPLRTIVITATKRPEPLRDLSKSVPVIGGAPLHRLHPVNFSGNAQMTPGMVMVVCDPVHVNLALQEINTEGVGATIGIYLDESPHGSSSALADGRIMTPNIDTFDLKRIELLSGPRGTLYGANTLGGLIRFVTNPRNPSRFDDEAQLGADDIAQAGFGLTWSNASLR